MSLRPGVGPAIELNGRMKYVMDTMNNHGRGLTDQVEDILDAQEILPPMTSSFYGSAGCDEGRKFDASVRA